MSWFLKSICKAQDVSAIAKLASNETNMTL